MPWLVLLKQQHPGLSYNRNCGRICSITVTVTCVCSMTVTVPYFILQRQFLRPAWSYGTWSSCAKTYPLVAVSWLVLGLKLRLDFTWRNLIRFRIGDFCSPSRPMKATKNKPTFCADLSLRKHPFLPRGECSPFLTRYYCDNCDLQRLGISESALLYTFCTQWSTAVNNYRELFHDFQGTQDCCDVTMAEAIRLENFSTGLAIVTSQLSWASLRIAINTWS